MIGLALWLCLTTALPRAPEAEAPASPARMACFRAAYPDVFCGASQDALVLCDGRRLTWDDGLGEKSYQAFLEHPDLEESVRMRYRPGPDFPTPPENFEPGRIRNEAFFRALYGADRSAVERDLVDVRWMPRRGGTSTVKVHRRVAAALQAVSDELEQALTPELAALAAKTAGAYTWRKVHGSQRTSMHSFGIAIDVGVSRSDYWDWHRPDKDGHYTWKNRFPWAIAAVFERHGFVWGAKWYHFDTMHFEYRPELFAPPCVDDGRAP
ncbi:MAG: M15 family metallopeptidase [Myxococcota bacterium]